MIVPSVRIVPHDDNRGSFPFRKLFDPIYRINQKMLFVERVRLVLYARVTVLICGWLQKTHGRHMPAFNCRKKVMNIVLMVRAVLVRSYKVDVAGSQMIGVSGCFEILEWLVMWYVVWDVVVTDVSMQRNALMFWLLWIDRPESALEPTPGYFIVS